MPRCSNKLLRDFFDCANQIYFDNRLLDSSIITFGKIKEDGICKNVGGVTKITIHEDLRKHPDLAFVVVLHEMLHADLFHTGYRGREHIEGHGTLFHAGIDRLYKAGAFEGLI